MPVRKGSGHDWWPRLSIGGLYRWVISQFILLDSMRNTYHSVVRFVILRRGRYLLALPARRGRSPKGIGRYLAQEDVVRQIAAGNTKLANVR